MKLTKLAGVALLLSGITACSTLSNIHWKNFDSQSPDDMALTSNQAGLIFYREGKDMSNKAINITVDGHYLASLQPNAFARATVCAQYVLINAALVNERILLEKSQKVELAQQEIIYIKVSEDTAGQVTLLPMDAQIAKPELQNVKHQVNTISRVVVNNCR